MGTRIVPAVPIEVDISPAAIEDATSLIDPVFTRTPQFVDEQLCAALGRQC